MVALPVHRGGARVGDTGDPIETLLDRLEDVDRADDVHARAEHRVGAAEGHLECGEVDDPRDPVLVERPPERFQVGDVAAHERQPLAVRWREDELQPVRCVAEVVADRLVAVLEHRLHGPGADTPERPGDQDALAQ